MATNISRKYQLQKAHKYLSIFNSQTTKKPSIITFIMNVKTSSLPLPNVHNSHTNYVQ